MVKLGRRLEVLGDKDGRDRGINLQLKAELTERQTNLGRESRGRSNFTAE